MSRALVAIALCGCNGILGIHAFGTTDASATGDSVVLGDVAAGSDGPTCLGSGLVTVCLASQPVGVATLGAQIDTDTGCTSKQQQSDGSMVCLVVARTVSASGGVRVSGSLPLVLVATETITIASGASIDASSHTTADGPAANATACDAGVGGLSVTGAAGGSLGTRGGNGGRSGGGGGNGGTSGATRSPVTLIGGCPGQPTGGSGVSGSGGGAIYFIAGSRIQIDGSVTANGAGARPTSQAHDGAGGGGSGGMIGFDAPEIAIAGQAFANGGGGAEGGGDTISGMAGDDPTSPSTPAPGGTGNMYGGDGGSGAAVSGPGTGGLDGTGNGPQRGGGGGGGGGLGIIRVFPGPVTVGGTVSPAPT